MTDPTQDDCLESLKQLEALSGAMDNLARTVAFYFKRLQELGIPEQIAALLVLEVQKTLFNPRGKA